MRNELVHASVLMCAREQPAITKDSNSFRATALPERYHPHTICGACTRRESPWEEEALLTHCFKQLLLSQQLPLGFTRE